MKKGTRVITNSDIAVTIVDTVIMPRSQCADGGGYVIIPCTAYLYETREGHIGYIYPDQIKKMGS